MIRQIEIETFFFAGFPNMTFCFVVVVAVVIVVVIIFVTVTFIVPFIGAYFLFSCILFRNFVLVVVFV